MKVKHINVVMILLCLFSCARRNSIEGIKDIRYTSIEIDTVHLDIPNSSYAGFSGVYQNNLYFLDQYFGYFYEISPDNGIIKRSMGIGQAANEIVIKQPSAATVYENKLSLLGSTYDAYLYTDLTDRSRIDIKVSEKNNSLEDSRAYTSYSEILRMNDSTLYYNIYSDVDFNNPFEHSKEYFRDAHIIMEVDLESGKAEPIGRYSDYYRSNHDKFRHLFTISYDIDSQNNFFISYMADSLVYKYDKNFKPISIFGFEGRDMDKAYTRSAPNIDDVNRAYQEDFIKNPKGHYYWIEYVDELDLVFRSYRKNKSSVTDGLQIYEGNVLIADVDVPKQFKVAGYIEPYFYSQIICDEDNKIMKIYRFKL